MYIYPGLVYDVKPATKEMEHVIAKDKFRREELYIPAVSKKFTLVRFSLPLDHVSSHISLMSLSSRQAELAKKVKEEREAGMKVREELIEKKNIRKLRKKKKMTMEKKEEIIVIEEEDEEDEIVIEEEDEEDEIVIEEEDDEKEEEEK